VLTAKIVSSLHTCAARDNILPLTSSCNLACVFCSHLQNPPSVQSYRLPPLPLEQVFAAASFLSPEQKIIIGESATRFAEGEPFTHPEILEILRGLRRMFPGTLLALTTNATLLSPTILAELAALQPLELIVSLNSSTSAGRRLLLGDREPDRAFQAVSALNDYGLPFHGSIVAMPHLVGPDDILTTIKFLAAHGALTTRLFLPGFTRMAPTELRFPDGLWEELSNIARELTRKLDMPVIPEPALSSDLTAEVYGIIRDTPAKKAGLLPGDILAAVDGKPVRTRVEAFNMVKKANDPLLTVRRDGRELTVSLRKRKSESPGFVMHYDINPLRLEEAGKKIRRARSRAPLLLASSFGEPLLLRAEAFPGLPDITVRAVENRFFGGSIKAAGLLVVADLLAAAKEALCKQHYDLVLVPQEAFDLYDCDLTGTSLATMEEKLGLPVQCA
jgi:NifB/MoaA-like Fe-S oxidoreductase